MNEAEIPDEKTVICTKGIDIWSTFDVNIHGPLAPCTHEEADTRLLLHAKHASKAGHKSIIIKTLDSDVVVLALHAFPKLLLSHLWVEYGVGKHKRFLPIHQYAEKLGTEICDGILFWHAFTGCDTVSAFAGRGKKTAWEAWRTNLEITAAFVELSHAPLKLDDTTFMKLQGFTVYLYDRTSNLQNVNDCRRMLVTKKCRQLESVPPTEAALLQHVKRAILQGGYIWSQWSALQPNLPDPEQWGWKRSDSGYTPLWSVLPELSKHCQELVRCGCKSLCTNMCKCAGLFLACTALCACDGMCK